MTTVLVAGGAGFIGNHLCRYLRQQGFWVRAADINPPAFGASEADDFMLLDLRDRNNCLKAVRGVSEVYQLAADMGGMSFLHDHHADVMRNNVLINVNMLEASRMQGVERFLFTSSACVYPEYRQMDAEVTALKEEDAYPAQPDLGYGWEKLFAEQMCHYYRTQYGLETRIARLHNCYGPVGTYQGGREKAPAALSRKIALASNNDTIEVFGDGEQTRSFLYVDDCVEGLYRLMRSDFAEPLNIGSSELVTINQLVDIIAGIAGKTIHKKHDLSQPQGVRGRNSDNSRIREVLGWEPSTPLAEGLRPTYAWIEQMVMKRSKVAA